MNDERKKNPDHSKQLASINRVIGQLEAIKKMIENRKYCPDIIQQVRAARGGMVKVEVMVLSSHISDCVKEALLSGDDIEIDSKSNEVANYVKSLII